VEPGNRIERGFGLAVDIGTTTIYGELFQLETGRVLAEGGDYNGQLQYGEDVISRIIYAERPGGLQRLQRSAADTVNEVIRNLLQEARVQPDEISSITLAGNTVMTHLFLGLQPDGIRRSPYVPVSTLFPPIRATDLLLDLPPQTVALVYPTVSSWVGGDIVSGIMGSGMYRSDKLTLYIDIGTNAEVVIGNRDWLACAACSAGPAFEGGGIQCGMRASAGAISDVRLHPETWEPMNSTIGGVPPVGLCGSGLLNLVAALLENRVIDRRGKFQDPSRSARIRAGRSGYEYVLAFAEEAGGQEDIVLTEVDIENFIRAKGAIFAGVRTLLAQVGLQMEDLEEVVLAGGFGSFIDIDSAIGIGLLPPLEPEKFFFVGNGSLLGCRMSGLSNHIRRDVRDVVSRMTSFELSEVLQFQDEYTAALFLPHTDEALFARRRDPGA